MTVLSFLFSPVFRHFSPFSPVQFPFPARHLLQIFFANLFPTCFNFMPHSRFRPALFHFLSHFHFHAVLFSTSFYYFQCIYNTFSLYFCVSSFSPYLLHTPKVFISSSNASLSVDSDKQRHRLSADGEPVPCLISFSRWRASDRPPAGGIRARGI